MSNERPETPKGTSPHGELIELTSGVVAAYVGNNSVSSSDLPDLIGTVYGTLSTLGAPAPEPEQEPAVSIKKSVTGQALICLECGKKQKMLKRHLATAHGMTPEEYRTKWGLAPTYPMSAPDYSEKRRALANQFGLGRKTAATKSKPKRKTAPKKIAPKKQG